MCNQRHVTNGLLSTYKWFKWRDFLAISILNVVVGAVIVAVVAAVIVAFKFEFGNLNRISVVPSAKAKKKTKKNLEDDREIHAISRMRFSRVVVATSC